VLYQEEKTKKRSQKYVNTAAKEAKKKINHTKIIKTFENKNNVCDIMHNYNIYIYIFLSYYPTNNLS